MTDLEETWVLGKEPAPGDEGVETGEPDEPGEAPESILDDGSDPDSPDDRDPGLSEEEDEEPPASLPRRLFGWAVRLLLVALVGWLVAGHVFLRTQVGPDLLGRSPERLQITWDDAWTPLPGLVWVRGIDVRGRTEQVGWHIRCEEAWLWIAPTELLLKRFRVRRLWASDLETQIRLRGRDAHGQPVIEGFDGLPEPHRKPPKPRPWQLLFDHLEVDGIRELWLGPQRYRPDPDGTDDGLATGSFRAVVRGELEVPWAEIDLAPGRAQVADQLSADLAELEIAGRLDPFVPRDHQALGRLRFFSGRASLVTRSGRIDLVDFYFRDTPISVAGDGRLTARLWAERGVLRAPSILRVDEGSFDGRYLGWSGRGVGRLSGRVAEDGSAVLDLSLEQGDLGRGDLAGEPLVRAGTVRLVASSPALDLASKRQQLEARVDLERSEITDVARLDDFLPENSPLNLRGGRGVLRGKATFDARGGAEDGSSETGSQDEGALAHGRFSGSLGLDGRKLEGVVNGIAMSIETLNLDLEISDGSTARRAFAVDGSRLEMRGVRSGKVTDWWLEVEVPSGTVEADPSAPTLNGAVTSWQVRADVEASVADTSPVVALVVEKKPALRWFDQLLTVHDLRATGELRADARRVELRTLQIDGSRRLRVRGEVRFGQAGYDALLHARWRAFAAGLHTRKTGIVDLDLRKSERWFEAQRTSFWAASD